MQGGRWSGQCVVARLQAQLQLVCDGACLACDTKAGKDLPVKITMVGELFLYSTLLGAMKRMIGLDLREYVNRRAHAKRWLEASSIIRVPTSLS